MIFIVYSQTNERTVADNIGQPEYSYYFILKSYLPILRRIGDVKIVYDPTTEVDAIYEECRISGTPCVFLHFSAPQNFKPSITCPTMHVIAWEYSTIPNEVWKDEEHQNWKIAFENTAGAITISAYTAETITGEMGPSFPVVSIPCPVWDDMEPLRQRRSERRPLKQYQLEFDGVVIDSRLVDLDLKLPTDEELDAIKREGDAQMFIMKQKNEKLNKGLAKLARDERLVEIEKAKTEYERSLIPHTVREVYTTTQQSAVQKRVGKLRSLSGRLSLLMVDTRKFLSNLLFIMGNKKTIEKHLAFSHAIPDHPLLKTGAPQTRPPDQTVERDQYVQLDNNPESVSERSATDSIIKNSIEIEGVVYTSIINPYDGRKNWKDMVLAFCWALRDKEDATLILKISARHIVQFSDELVFYLQRLAPFKCRIIAIQAYLNEEVYATLLDGTTFYVNTSYGEGQSIPLCEALSSGIPAIAPTHTAMRDYVSESSCVTFETHAELTHWQHDPRRSYRCVHFKPDWESLVSAYQRSYEIAQNAPPKYKSMGQNASDTLKDHCSLDVTTKNFEHFILRHIKLYDHTGTST